MHSGLRETQVHPVHGVHRAETGFFQKLNSVAEQAAFSLGKRLLRPQTGKL